MTTHLIEQHPRPEQPPSIGRIVHYVGPGDTDPPCAAAVITAVGDSASCSLAVFLPESSFTAHNCAQSEDGREGGTWHWPERV